MSVFAPFDPRGVLAKGGGQRFHNDEVDATIYVGQGALVQYHFKQQARVYVGEVKHVVSVATTVPYKVFYSIIGYDSSPSRGLRTHNRAAQAGEQALRCSPDMAIIFYRRDLATCLVAGVFSHRGSTDVQTFARRGLGW
jgi:hypothetical protein